jgi:hypothetical protein
VEEIKITTTMTREGGGGKERERERERERRKKRQFVPLYRERQYFAAIVNTQSKSDIIRPRLRKDIGIVRAANIADLYVTSYCTRAFNARHALNGSRHAAVLRINACTRTIVSGDLNAYM